MSSDTIISNAFFEGACLYKDVLNISKEPTSAITQADLRKAYYRNALKYHPDKNDSEEAKCKFQAISIAYNILKNPTTKKEYDETGELINPDDEDNDIGGDASNKNNVNMWKNVFTTMFGSVTISKINDFAAKYKCSDEEKRDVIKYYKQYKGDLNKMLDCVMLSEPIDVQRWIDDYINPSIDDGEITDDYNDKLSKTFKSIQKQLNNSKTKEKSSSKKKNNSKKRKIDDDEDNDDTEEVVAEAVVADDDDDDDDDDFDPDATESEEDDDDNDDEEDDEEIDDDNDFKEINNKKKKSTSTKSVNKTKALPKKGKATITKKTIKKKATAASIGKKKKNNKNDEPDFALIAAIRGKHSAENREASFDNMISGIKDRYGVVDDDPLGNNDEFAKIQAKLLEKKKQKNSTSTKQGRKKTTTGKKTSR